jgi:hypothetical protein
MINLPSVSPAQAGVRAELKRTRTLRRTAMATMKAAIFVEKNRIARRQTDPRDREER